MGAPHGWIPQWPICTEPSAIRQLCFSVSSLELGPQRLSFLEILWVILISVCLCVSPALGAGGLLCVFQGELLFFRLFSFCYLDRSYQSPNMGNWKLPLPIPLLMDILWQFSTLRNNATMSILI